jgi:hypothetical protein
MCWTLNHQNILEMAQEHISLSIMPLGVEFERSVVPSEAIMPLG